MKISVYQPVLCALLLLGAMAGTAQASDDMDVTMEMVRDDDALRDFVVHEMALPEAAAERARSASESGRETAEGARERGRDTAEEARERARDAREQRGQQRDLPVSPIDSRSDSLPGAGQPGS